MVKKTILPKVSAIILAGGKGKRMGRPKQMISIAGKPMLFRAVETFANMPQISEVIIVAGNEDCSKCKSNFISKKIKYALPGSTRLRSVISGMNKISKNSKLISVHDGARPLVTKKIISDCLRKANTNGASVAAVSSKDTVKVSRDGKTVEKTLNRTHLWQAQTPQCYKTHLLKKAIGKFSKYKNVTDESQLLEKMGVKISLVKSDYQNIKVTTPDDLAAAESFAKLKESKNSQNTDIRIGFGYDVHRMVEGRPFIIGGVSIAHNKGLLGHSDGDLILHAVCDAILGSVSAGEIGMFFPPTDLTLMGISSTVIAEKTLEVLKSKNAKLVQIDATVVIEEPKIFPYYEVIRQSLAKIFRLSVGNVSFKAKSQERLGAVGSGDAAVCHALALVRYV
ncbi:MAG TPA: 2-C-methyl-D-erythritol 4-phosphate cytidylyltransferase [Elusimicrobiales bacterium]|nr:2-C-methyl-D-erythritol 4-phosphate cytidylyltransferase [Elusimicrobiales bacterium]